MDVDLMVDISTDIDLKVLDSVVAGAESSRPGALRIADSRLSKGTSLVALARHDPSLHRLTKDLAARGYFESWSFEGGAKLVHRTWIPQRWSLVASGEMLVSPKRVIYTLQKPARGVPSSLVVVFSSIPTDYNDSSLNRYFAQDYRHVSSLTPEGTAVLRIADVGGVVGAFYSDTCDDPRNRSRISDLITHSIAELGIDSTRVCLLGSSKGATGAVLHGLLLNLPFVAVDPILSDSYYELERYDAHFTGHPVFPCSKDDLFSNLLAESNDADAPHSALVTSPRSEQFPVVRDFAHRVSRPMTVASSNSPAIRGHAYVAKSAMGATMSLTNFVLSGWPLPSGWVNV